MVRSLLSRKLAWLIVVAGALAAADLSAAPPGLSLIPFKRIEVDDKKSYEIGEQNGPWMVYATSFAGERAEQQAHDLVMELRRQFKMPAYIHKQHYDFSQPVDGLGFNRYGEVKKMRHVSAREFDEVAVMVGNFTAIDDPKLQDTLNKIKYLRPAVLDPKDKKSSYQRFGGLRYLQRLVHPDEEQRTKGPMGNAFATRNPVLPEGFDANMGIDPLVIEMNRDAEFSLLKNGGKYTVKVATFRGLTTMKLDEIERIERGAVKSRLEEAAIKAHTLASALRAQGIEAYEFHDRNESIVCVGSFDSVGEPDANGKIELNPAVYKIMQQYGPKQTPVDGQVGLQPRSIKGIPFDVQPIPVQVPRVSIASNLSRSRLWE